MILDGLIDVSGSGGAHPGSSGGSGGSILLKSKSLKGKGTVTADGGGGESSKYGGGGSGGRIALYSDTFSFTGKLN